MGEQLAELFTESVNVSKLLFDDDEYDESGEDDTSAEDSTGELEKTTNLLQKRLKRKVGCFSLPT